MRNLTPLEPIDYLVIGHITRDLTPDGPRLGGTAAYAALTARALGLRVGIVTSWGSELPLGLLQGLPVINYPADQSTTFENKMTPDGRIQFVHSVASSLDFYHIPEPWRNTPIVHLGPVAQEVEPGLARYFPASLIGVTPQGWLRNWSRHGQVAPCEWPEANFLLGQAGAVVISTDDVGRDEGRIEEMVTASRVIAVTEAAEGARVYWNGDVRRFRRSPMREVDATGAGDIFAAAFFTRLHVTRDPWEAGRFATQLASYSVMRPGLEAIPTPEEIQETMVEVFE
ncbi:MAG: ribokinase [Chloroflexota bacterium]|nr:MAG: ribokinase [Chloroflexota bacterium]